MAAITFCRAHISSSLNSYAASIRSREFCAKKFAPQRRVATEACKSFLGAGAGLKASIGKQANSQNRAVVRKVAAMAAPAVDLETFGKAVPGSGSPSDQRGDCPFSHRTYLELEEKGLSYKSTFIEEGDNKPDWFMKNNPKGLMPVLRDGEKWIQDSDKIFEHLEAKFPEPSLKPPPGTMDVGSGIFPAFTSWLEAKNPQDKSKQEVIKELKALDSHLKTKGPYLAGDKLTDADLALSPKLLHLRVALAHYYDFKIPDELTALKDYMHRMEERPSFKKTSYPDSLIVKGWQTKFDLPDQIGGA